MPSEVRKEVMSATGTACPTRAAVRSASSNLRSRKVFPSTTGTSAFTAPPKRVPAPPATTSAATRPSRSSALPIAASRACSGVPGDGSGVTSPGRSGSSVPGGGAATTSPRFHPATSSPNSASSYGGLIRARPPIPIPASRARARGRG